MMKNMRRGIPNLFKEGTKHRSGIHEAIIKNIEAVCALADITKTSLGPNGMNKMIVNYLGKLFVTSDSAVILKEMEVAHPAANLLVMAAHMQEAEIGDGSNFVICLGGELLAHAEELLVMGLNINDVISGYTKASREVLRILDDLVVEKIDAANIYSRDAIIRAVKAPIASKQYGYEDLLSPLVADACLAVMPKNPFNFVVDNVRVVKILGGNIANSEVVKGMVIPQDVIGSTKRVENAKIAVFTSSIGIVEPETKGTVLINNAKELMNYNISEERELEKLIKQFATSGVNVVVTGSTVDDLAEHFLEKFGIMTLKISSKFDLRRLCKATKARALPTLAPVSPEDIGFCTHVYVREIGAQKVTVFQQGSGDNANVATILLRASTSNLLNDLERAIDDGVNTVRAIGRDGRFVAGAGAVEIELARRLSTFASKQPGIEQYALNHFATALEVIPKQLASNAGFDSMEVISKLYAAHETGQINAGVNIETGDAIDAVELGVIDLLSLKNQAIRLTMDAVMTLLRIDSIIQAKAAGGPRAPQPQTNWDED